MAETASNKRKGARRSEDSRAAILAASRDEISENGWRKFSVDRVAKRARASKQTIYRWWPSKAALIVDAFLTQIQTVLPFPETVTAAEALGQQMQRLVEVFRGDVGQIVAQIVAEGQCDSGALESFCDRFLSPRRDAARQVIMRGIESGEFDPALDPDLAMDILYGPIYYRLLVQHLPLDEAFAAALFQRAIACLQLHQGLCSSHRSD